MHAKSTDTLSFRSSETVRKNLPAVIAEVAYTNSALPFGSNPKRPRYQIVAARHFTANDLAKAAHISIDQARKSWADLRAAVRLFDFKFVLTVDRTGLAVIQRHPGYTRTTFQRLINQCRQVGSTDERIANLERAVEDLHRRVGKGGREND